LTQRVAPARPTATRPRLSAAGTEGLWRLSPLGVGLAAFVLGLIELTKQPLSFDEKVTLATATRPLGEIWDAARATEAPHLAYYVLMKPWLAAAGTSEWAARFPSVVFGALAALVVTALGARLFGRSAGLVAGLTLATGAYFVHWSQQARGYTLAVFLATLATYAFVRAVHEPSTSWWALWAVCLVTAAWASLFAVSVLAAHLAAFFALRPRPPARAPALALLATVVSVAPIAVLVSIGNNGQLDWIPAPTASRVAVQTWDWASRNPFLLLAGAAGAGALIAGVAPRIARWKAVLVCVWLVAPFAVTLLLSAIQPAFESRYLLTAAPALALLVGAAWATLPRRLSLAVVALVAVGAGLRLAQLYVVPGQPLSDLF
jgi:mannosyltransferase